MPWVKLDDNFASHPKVFQAGAYAWGFFTGCIAYANRNRTGGFIPAAQLALVFPSVPLREAVKLCERLVSAKSPGKQFGMLEVVEGGWQIHNYSRYQPIRDAAMDAARRVAKAEAGRLGGIRSGESRRALAADSAGNEFDRGARKRATAEVALAIKRGELTPEPCRECGSTLDVDAHHHDYSKPLDVVWLCNSCHSAHHVELRAKQSASSDLEAKRSPAPAPAPAPAPKLQLQKRRSTTSSVSNHLPDDRFIESLKTNPAYQGIDVDREIGKLDAWLLTPRGKGKQKTRGRIVNWLNRVDRPMVLASSAAPRGRNPNHSISCECERCAHA